MPCARSYVTSDAMIVLREAEKRINGEKLFPRAGRRFPKSRCGATLDLRATRPFGKRAIPGRRAMVLAGSIRRRLIPLWYLPGCSATFFAGGVHFPAFRRAVVIKLSPRAPIIGARSRRATNEKPPCKPLPCLLHSGTRRAAVRLAGGVRDESVAYGIPGSGRLCAAPRDSTQFSHPIRLRGAFALASTSRRLSHLLRAQGQARRAKNAETPVEASSPWARWKRPCVSIPRVPSTAT